MPRKCHSHVSAGEPFHFKEAGRDWLVNWYMVREKGVTLFGPPPQTIIEPVSKAEFLEVVKGHVRIWREWVDEMQQRGAQAYAILTLCRAVYTLTHGEQVSRIQAARWAEKELPEWSALIQQAVLWRQASPEDDINPAATFPETQRFVHFVADKILG